SRESEPAQRALFENQTAKDGAPFVRFTICDLRIGRREAGCVGLERTYVKSCWIKKETGRRRLVHHRRIALQRALCRRHAARGEGRVAGGGSESPDRTRAGRV